MKRRSRTHVVAAGLIACLAAPALLAQSERVSARIVPRPNQTIRITMIQEADVEMSLGGQAPAGAPIRMSMITTSALTQKTGALKPDGSLDAEMRYDEVRAAMTMNNQTMPIGDVVNQLVGKVVVVTYDRNGQVMGSRFSNDFPGTADMVTQILAAFSGNLPSAALAVGEVVSVPIDMNVPLPIPGTSAMKMSGETKLTLVAIDKDAKGRFARFDSTTEGKMVSDSSVDGKTTMRMDFTITGSGTTLIDLDAGFVRSGQSKNTVSGKMTTPPAAVPASPPGMTVHGTMRTTFAGSN